MFGNSKKKIAALEERLATLDQERATLQQQLEQARQALAAVHRAILNCLQTDNRPGSIKPRLAGVFCLESQWNYYYPASAGWICGKAD